MEFVVEPQQRKFVSVVPRECEQKTVDPTHRKLKFAYAEATGPEDGPEAMQRAQKAGTLYKYVIPIRDQQKSGDSAQ